MHLKKEILDLANKCYAIRKEKEERKKRIRMPEIKESELLIKADAYSRNFSFVTKEERSNLTATMYNALIWGKNH